MEKTLPAKSPKGSPLGVLVLGDEQNLRGTLAAYLEGLGCRVLAVALWQAPRVARARGAAPERLEAVVRANLHGRDLGFLGEPRVNVLLLNLALDRQFGRC